MSSPDAGDDSARDALFDPTSLRYAAYGLTASCKLVFVNLCIEVDTVSTACGHSISVIR